MAREPRDYDPRARDDDDRRRLPPGFSAPLRVLVPFLIVCVFTLSIGLSTYFTVEGDERAIVTRAGAVEYVAEPGLHFKAPFLDSTHFRSVQLQSITTPVLNSYTIDNQEVDATLVVQYVAPADQLAYIYTNVGDLPTKLLTMTADRWKIEAGKINVSSFAATRGKLVADTRKIVQDEAARLYHVAVIDVQLVNMDYQKSYRDAQANAAVIKTQVEAAQQSQDKAKIEAETARITAAGQAAQAIETARGAAEGVRLAAIAKAEATRVQGAAEAHAKQLMAEALTSNPVLVEFQKALAWDGRLPVNMYAGAPLPFLNVPASPSVPGLLR